jgi:molybdopterin/thiamine biosynthesis adenylyltransferase
MRSAGREATWLNPGAEFRGRWPKRGNEARAALKECPERTALTMDAQRRERYSRQILFSEIGEQGQERLSQSSAVAWLAAARWVRPSRICWCAPESAGSASWTAISWSRQTCSDRRYLRKPTPMSRCQRLSRRKRGWRRSIQMCASKESSADLNPDNIDELLAGFPLLLDGTDNFETRLLVNDYAVSRSIPWIYAAVVASYGLTMTIRPGKTACLACLMGSDHGDGDGFAGVAPQSAEATCDTVGVLGAAAGVIASMQAASAMQFLLGKSGVADGRLLSYDVWTGRFQSVTPQRDADCRACARREFSYLQGQAQPHLTLCGRDSVQIHERRRRLDLGALGRQLAAGGQRGSAQRVFAAVSGASLRGHGFFRRPGDHQGHARPGRGAVALRALRWFVRGHRA